MPPRLVRLGLFGIPGAGKSTATSVARAYCRDLGIPFRLVKLADPLYQAQAAIYAICGRPQEEFYRQDGELLNFLGAHMRKINPSVLLERFDDKLGREIQSLAGESAGSALILCDDVRAPDAAFLVSRGFGLVRIDADPEECARRRGMRGDLTQGSAAHSSEAGLDTISTNHALVNRGSLAAFESRVRALLTGLLA